MHEDSPIIEATPRKRIGTRYAKRERQAGRLPVNVYGHGEAPVAATVDARTTLRHIHAGEKVFRLMLEGQSVQVVLLKELQFDHLGTNIVHADLARVDLNERIRARVPIRLIGMPKVPAGSVLVHPTSEIEIECMLSRLPDELEVDVTVLTPDSPIHARDVKLPYDTMKLLTDPDAILAAFTRAAAEEVAESATIGGGAAAPEVITERKKEAGDKA